MGHYLWSGRMKKELCSVAKNFTFSIDVDKKLALFDISGSIAHVQMLVKQKIIKNHDGKKIISGLKKIRDEIRNNSFVFKENDEDIHTAIERRLNELVGSVAGKMHTARSRNDQVVLDEKLYLKNVMPEIENAISSLQSVLVDKADAYFDICIPEFTHFQPAQPVLFSHHLLAFVEMFERDKQRIQDCLKREDICPLGACACAGTSFPVDPEFVAQKLTFQQVFRNSIDAVSDRDFILETLAVNAMLMLHLSRMAEELIIWHNPLIGFVELPDEFCTGSSIMPQKKNPDVLELIRGKTSTIIGNLTGMFTLIKALPLSYNRDLQEDKRFLFESCEISHLSLILMAEIMKGTKINREKMENACHYGYIEATDIAEFLSGKGIPFRQAHHIVAKIVGFACEKGVRLFELKDTELKKLGIDDDTINFIKNLDVHKSIHLKRSPGSTGIKQVKEEVKRWKNILK